MPNTDLENNTTGSAQVELLRSSRVPLGISLVYYGLALMLLAQVVAFLPLIGPFDSRMLFDYSNAVMQLLAIVASLLSLVGTGLCLTASNDMPGKKTLYVACVLDAAALFINVAYHFLALPFVIAVSSGLHSAVGFVCFLFFLKLVGGFLRNSKLTSNAMGLLNLGGTLIVVTVLWNFSSYFPRTPLARFVTVTPLSSILFGLLWSIVCFVIVLRFARLLRDLKQSFARE